MPDMKLAYIVTNVGNGNKFLSDSMEFVPLALSLQNADGNVDISNFNQTCSEASMPIEIFAVGLGHYGRSPILFIRTKTDLLIYRVFRYPRGHLKIRFRKLSHGVMLPLQSSDSNRNAMETEDEEQTSNAKIRTIRYFDNVSGHNGVVITGDKPYLILLTARGELRTHEFYGQTAMKSFAPFNNVNCPNGLIYFDHNNELQIAIFPNYLNYDSNWPVRKVPLRCTPSAIVYHKETKIYCVVTDTEEENHHYYRFNGEDKELTEEVKGER